MAETPLPLKDKLEINVPHHTPAAPNAIPSNSFRRRIPAIRT